MRSLVKSIFLYACEFWTLKAGLQRRIQAMEMRCYRKILRIMQLIQRACNQRGSPRQDPAGNRTTRKSAHRKETQTEMARASLPFIRSGQNRLARHSERERRQGRWRKRWEDNINEWTGLEFAKSQRAVEKREKWMKLVSKSFVAPQQPSRSRDR